MSPFTIREVGSPDPDASREDVAYYNATMEHLGRAINEALKSIPGRDDRRITWMLAIDLPLPSGDAMFGGFIGNDEITGPRLLKTAAWYAEREAGDPQQ